VMDGYEATREIRLRSGLKGLPVIAMTANAMSEDRQRSLDCGMNDHIAKPIDVNRMFQTLAKWITPSAPEPERIAANDEPGADPIELPRIAGVDTDAGLRVANGNRRLYRKLLVKFRNQQRDFRGTFQQALDGEDPAAAARLAHTLKGVAGNLGIRSVEQSARDLESACSAADQRRIATALQSVEHHLRPVIAGLDCLDEDPRTRQAATADCGPVDSQVRRLRHLLESCDTGASAALESLSATASMAPHARALDQISQMLEDYDFESALAELRSLEPALHKAATDEPHRPLLIVSAAPAEVEIPEPIPSPPSRAAQ